jgi:phage-related protein
MRLPLSLCTKKNALSDLGAWIVLIDINLAPLLKYTAWITDHDYVIDNTVEYDGISYASKTDHTSALVYPPNDPINWEEAGILRVCQSQYLENLTYPTTNGYLYTRFPFDIDAVGEANTGEVPAAVLKISNINGYMESYADAYAGFKNAKVTIRVVHNAELNERNVPTHTYTVMTSGTDDTWMSFSLGAENPYNQRALKDNIYKMFCRYEKFKGRRCRFGENIWFADRGYYEYQIVFDRPTVNDPFKPYRALSDIKPQDSIDSDRASMSASWEAMEWAAGNYTKEEYCWWNDEWYEAKVNLNSAENPLTDADNWKVLTCDRSLDTCRNKLHNAPYFGGFPALAIGDFIQW